ncbi:MAG: pilus assembly PilX N-terminal domain-containing protein [Acidobacteria bacterium]|nr:pilus assembly PilX N-terminal domain-containing protein [Acidobacteriota bacterium]
MRLADEKGVALIMVLILMGVLSVLGASLIFVSQTETWASQNYRLMSDARYGAESGIHRAANFFLYSTSYSSSAPGTPADPLSNYNITKSPVEYNGQPVQLRSNGASNYPVQSIKDAFTTNAHGTLTSGYPLVYDARATLLSMRQVVVYGSATPVTVQTWQIVGEGSIAGGKPARVDVSAIVERQIQPMFNYAAFATDPGCAALSWSGGANTDSYDSSAALVGGEPVISESGGNVGTNGNLDENGAPTIINGSLSTPRTGVGSCTQGTVTALTLSGSPAPSAGLIELAQNVTYPTPDVPNPAPTGNFTVNNGATVSKTGGGSYGDITIKGKLQLSAGTYNINTLTMNAGGILEILTGPVILNVAGYSTAGNPASGLSATPINMTGGSLTTAAGFDPANFQLTYAGTGTIKMAGGAKNTGLIYAPNATIQDTSANSEWYGAVIGKKVSSAGHSQIHYDRRLQTGSMTVGPWMMNSFSWRRF